MDEFENEGRGVTLGDIFRTIFSQKWLALVLTFAIAIVGTLSVYFIGKINEYYSVAFVLQLPNSGDATSTSYTYPDGENFYFTDLISSENLKLVASREQFSDVDVDKMVKRGDISIARTIDKLDDESQGGVFDLNYTIKAKSKYFKDEDEARDFIEALTEFPRKHIVSMEIDYDQSLTTSKSAITYSEQLTLLKNQAYYIQAVYNSLIVAYGGEFVVDSGKTLTQYKDEIDAYITQDLFTSLKGLADTNGYIKSADAKLKYEGDKKSKELDLQHAKAKLQTLEEFIKQGVSSTMIDGEIVSLTGEIGTLEYEIEILQGYIDSFENESKINPAGYEADIAKVEAAVTAFTEGIKPVASYVYGRVTKINYLSSKIVEVDGGYGLMMSVAIGLVTGLVIAAVAAYIVGWNKNKKAAKVAENAGEVPAYGEAQLQAAVTVDEDEKKDEK